MLDAGLPIGRRASSPTASSACSRSRSRLATRPKVLLLDEPAAGVPSEESKELFAAIAGLPRDITVLFIEHDMDLVFRFASRIIVMVGGSVLVEGTPHEIADRCAGARGLSRQGRRQSARLRAAMAEPLIALDDSAPATAPRVVLDGVAFDLPERGSLAVLGRNGVGKSTLLLTIMGYTQIAPRPHSLARHRHHAASRRIAARRAGIGWVAQEREIFSTLTVEENLTVAARAGRWDLAAVYDLFPRLAERRRNFGNQLSGGEQQMLAIARALMTNPALLLLDEPLEGLAPIVVEELDRRNPAHDRRRRQRLHPGRAARRHRAALTQNALVSSAAASCIPRPLGAISSPTTPRSIG